MAFQKGLSGNPAGKPRGAKNRVHKLLRENIVDFLSDEFENVKKVYAKLSPRDKLRFYTDLMAYGIPKLQAMSLDVDFDKMTDEQLDEIIERLKNTL
jgi:hypothetical protein